MNNPPELLPADRQRFLKEHLMSEIAAETKAPKPRRRLVWLVASPLAVGALAAVTLAVPDRHHGDDAPAAPVPSASSAPSPTATPLPEPTDPAGLLARAAKAAAGSPDPGAKAAQFVYRREIQDGARETKHERKSWMSVDGRSQGLILDPTMGGGRTDWPATLSTASGAPRTAGFSAPTYEFVASLPTDPQQLLKQLLSVDRSTMVAGMPMTPKMYNQFAFGDVQMIFQNISAPPAVAAALMQAAAKIPGTAVVADETDAAGRHGVAVVGTNGTMRVALIFDKTTGAFLGVREVLLADLPPAGPDGLPPAGTPSPGAGDGKGYDYASAVLASAIVDKLEAEPAN
ncbi:CU044_5270 family protein [Streptomyces sp. SP17BM10]|uniref:CU044_5270 family protein n=1 Tax=Streptomyces sp. SP17BM10 TaxID=3002530 RepID=UPI002E75CC90|nr:CU044_5270 family protein [Streptomyces sp. SP17BM10]MEE1783105.1 CU044_5270 family protein [Streptomyces sp. SP17BM10]